MKYKIAIALILQCYFSVLFSQESLSGVVVSESRKGRIEAVPFANVYWMNTNIGTSTDSSGAFQLAKADNSNTLVISSVGYQSDTITIKSFNRIETIKLKQSVLLKQVEVEYRRKTSEMSFINPLATENMSERELFKAACCNLSESFETNPSVDVNFTDAVTGTKQIRMLGLDGPYTMISRENMPGVRGLGNAFGLTFIPGTWISSIQVTKGVGSVINGYESIAGQINTELKKPEEGEQLFLNLFANQSGRSEVNFVNTHQVSENWGTTLLLHGNLRPFQRDQNADGFMDFPQQEQFNVMNRWKFDNRKGWMGQVGAHYIKDEKEGGQTDDYLKNQEQNGTTYIPYRLNINTEKVELFTKTGYVFPSFKYKSMGLQLSAVYHDQQSTYGVRDYDAEQKSGYANFIYQSIIGNSFHKFKTGVSFLYDDFNEKVEEVKFTRTERVPGAFFEYTYAPTNNVTMVAGVRVDHHNLFGAFVTPRLHLRWAANETTVFRLLGGSGQRTANIFAERQSLFVTSRSLELLGNQNLPYGLQAEKAWNFGFNVTKNFTWDYRDGYLSLDFYRTEFVQQAVLDLDESPDRALFYNLDGESYSNSAQIEFNYEVVKFLDLRVAYRWLEVRTDYLSGQRQKPLTAKHRWFANIGYETQKNLKEANWMFDLTAQWIGQQRIPTTESNSIEYQRESMSPAFTLFNTQVSRNFNKRWAVYLGMENILDYRQDNPIIDAANPFGNNFDASLVWGPIFGRMFYGGVRFRVQEKK